MTRRLVIEASARTLTRWMGRREAVLVAGAKTATGFLLGLQTACDVEKQSQQARVLIFNYNRSNGKKCPSTPTA